MKFTPDLISPLNRVCDLLGNSPVGAAAWGDSPIDRKKKIIIFK